jgi:hypothetical protein
MDLHRLSGFGLSDYAQRVTFKTGRDRLSEAADAWDGRGLVTAH